MVYCMSVYGVHVCLFVFLYSHIEYGTLKQMQTVKIQSVDKKSIIVLHSTLSRNVVTFISPPTKLTNLNTQSDSITLIITFMILKF